jgi:hypothetical protein
MPALRIEVLYDLTDAYETEKRLSRRAPAPKGSTFQHIPVVASICAVLRTAPVAIEARVRTGLSGMIVEVCHEYRAILLGHDEKLRLRIVNVKG